MSAASSSAAPAIVQRSGSVRRSSSQPGSSPQHPSRSHSSAHRGTGAAAAAAAASAVAAPRPPSQGYRPSREAAAPHPSTTTTTTTTASATTDRYYDPQQLARSSSTRKSTSRDSYQAAPIARSQSTRAPQRQGYTPSRTSYSRDGAAMAETATAVSKNSPTPVTVPGAPADHPDRYAHVSSSRQKRPNTVNGKSGVWYLGKTIGAGSMGKVKIARLADSNETVACKIVPRQAVDSHGHSRRDEKADHSKEIRTAREAAIVTLLDHPYICALREVVQTNHHWYMMFEYVNGGQMLDYIISHGKLKEKQARKFGRQIASALDYCHRNSIVHRDLKIENILISKSGDIKIIDFGLSNLFSPASQLKTFCGSLYFAAPELLQARQYTGPEVDVWSFGIVMYVLVCGKVPFDDQSMPQLHAKIKKGHVDYPPWLTHECRDLINRMLQVNPRERAPLKEILQHPWMNKGFNGPPENYLPHREPLQLPLDPRVVQSMTGFDFGTPEYITERLTRIIESDGYQNAVRLAARDGHSQISGTEKKRGFGAFDFYKKRTGSTSKDVLSMPSVEALPLGQDPINAYDPLISIYYLVREAQDREKAKNAPPSEPLLSPTAKNIKVPELATPAAAVTNPTSYEIPGEGATGGRTRPRARTHGEDEIADSLKRTDLNASSKTTASAAPPLESTPKKESTAAGLLRRFSTRKHRDADRERTTKPAVPTPNARHEDKPEESLPLPEKSVTTKQLRDRETQPTSSTQPASEPLPTSAAPTQSSKPLGRSSSVIESDWRKRQARKQYENAHLPVPENPASGSEKSVPGSARLKVDAAADSDASKRTSTSMRTKSLGHARRESIQARRARRDEANAASGNEKDTHEREPSPTSIEAESKPHAAESVKPVFLKGLFSVQTTSTKPVSVIRQDIIRVLDSLGVNYKEIKGGFSCRHVPSINLEKVSIDVPRTPERTGHRRKISFGGIRDRDRDRDEHKDLAIPKSPVRRRGNEGSFTGSEASNESIPGGQKGGASGENGSSMILQYDINIVKVPLLSLHGIQFKRVAGDTWQYKEMATKILAGLKL